MSTEATPLSRRRGDWFFVVTLALFTLGSLVADAPKALGLAPARADPNDAYVNLTGDRYFASDPMPLRVRLLLSAFVFAPLTAYLSYAIAQGRPAARPVALLYGGAMTVAMAEYFAWEWASGTPPERPAAFFMVNGPYLLVALAIIARMWKPRPFGAEA